VTTRGDRGRAQPPFADGPVQRLLADAQELRRLAGTDELGASGPAFMQPGQSIDVLGVKAAMASGCDYGRPEQASRDSAKNRRSAHAKAGC
jgi:hypothetical protein